jgi:hypothetical protein
MSAGNKRQHYYYLTSPPSYGGHDLTYSAVSMKKKNLVLENLKFLLYNCYTS